jgi:hypothetical protein
MLVFGNAKSLDKAPAVVPQDKVADETLERFDG